MPVSESDEQTVVRADGLVWQIERGKEAEFAYVRSWLLHRSRPDSNGTDRASEDAAPTAKMDTMCEIERTSATATLSPEGPVRLLLRAWRLMPAARVRDRPGRGKLDSPVV